MPEDKTDTTVEVAFNWPDLLDGETPIEDASQILWRQVHPNHVSPAGVIDGVAFEEIVTMEAINGTEDARDEVSMTQGTLISAEEAYVSWTGFGKTSAGSYGVTVEEVVNAKARAVDDSRLQDGEEAIPGHAYIDLRGFPNKPKTHKRRAKSILAAAATYRRRQFPKD
jgi:hypothetical protein